MVRRRYRTSSRTKQSTTATQGLRPELLALNLGRATVGVPRS
jgi:hypothetical protein